MKRKVITALAILATVLNLGTTVYADGVRFPVEPAITHTDSMFDTFNGVVHPIEPAITPQNNFAAPIE